MTLFESGNPPRPEAVSATSHDGAERLGISKPPRGRVISKFMNSTEGLASLA